MGLLTSSVSVFSEVSRIHSAGKNPFATTMQAAMKRRPGPSSGDAIRLLGVGKAAVVMTAPRPPGTPDGPPRGRGPAWAGPALGPCLSGQKQIESSFLPYDAHGPGRHPRR